MYVVEEKGHYRNSCFKCIITLEGREWLVENHVQLPIKIHEG